MSPSAKSWATAERWNRKVHYYAGLYLLFFIWLFSLTGLLLNHGDWSLARAANARQETKYEAEVSIVTGMSVMSQAKAAADQLGLRGELDLPAFQPPGQIVFNVSRPNDSSQVRIDLAQRRASIQHYRNNAVGTVRVFHAFSGTRVNQPDSHRDWLVTSVWVLAMDAVAAGLIVIVFGSYVMWYRLKRRHGLGWLSLGTGVLCCGLLLRVLF